MSRWSRLVNVFRGNRVEAEIDEELASHLDEAIAGGRDPADARRALGSVLRHRDASRDIRLAAWLDALRADIVFGGRRLRKNPVTSAAAILSLALAIGGCTAAFRIIDALLLRPLPVAHPEELHLLSRQGTFPFGNPQMIEGWEYPLFERMRDAVNRDAELLAVSYSELADLTYSSHEEMEKTTRQFVSGTMFPSLGVSPALGRVFTRDDDRAPGAHPYAVLSYDYWTRRFARDPHIIGRTFRMDTRVYEIVGVAAPPFTGTEPGMMIDVFLPTMMHGAVTRSDASWHRTFARVRPGVSPAALRDRLQGIATTFHTERAQGFTGMPRATIDSFIAQRVAIEPSPTGVSILQHATSRALVALAVLVSLVLLIACANVANLMLAQAAARSREMALRVSIGAGRARLVQLVLLESVLLAACATALGALFAWWSAPLVVSLINPPDNPARLALPMDWRLFGFGLLLTLIVTSLFGLAPALRASAVTPLSALKGGDDPRTHGRSMFALIAGQVGFCVLVLFIAGMFVTTFERLAHQSTGFSTDRLLTLEAVAAPPGGARAAWDDVANHLRAVPGVESVAVASQTLLSGVAANGFVSIDGGPLSPVMAYSMGVSPGWIETMRIPLIAGRDLRPTDVSPGTAIVNETFARTFFNGANPVGRTFERPPRRWEIVGLVGDARYRNMREPMLPVAYSPLTSIGTTGLASPMFRATFIVRTASADPLTIAPLLRRAVPAAQPGMRVSTIRTQAAINASHMIRERLVAMLASFFAIVALALAAVGLYGVLHYSVLRRRREIGIRLAIGATTFTIVRGVTFGIFAMVVTGAIAGVASGLYVTRYLEKLFYGVTATDPVMLAMPVLTMAGVAVVAALPPVRHALRTDLVKILRAD